MKIIKLSHGVNVIVEWDGVIVSQDSELIPLGWKEWDMMINSVEEIRKHDYSKK